MIEVFYDKQHRLHVMFDTETNEEWRRDTPFTDAEIAAGEPVPLALSYAARKTRHCPSCGAPYEPLDKACSYCKTARHV